MLRRSHTKHTRQFTPQTKLQTYGRRGLQNWAVSAESGHGRHDHGHQKEGKEALRHLSIAILVSRVGSVYGDGCCCTTNCINSIDINNNSNRFSRRSSRLATIRTVPADYESKRKTRRHHRHQSLRLWVKLGAYDILYFMAT